MARALMVQSGLPGRYTADAAMCATYILNRTAIRRDFGRLRSKLGAPSPSNIEERPCERSIITTPYELVFHESPDIKHLRPFGCRAYVHVAKGKRGKKVSKNDLLSTFTLAFEMPACFLIASLAF